MKLTRAVEKVYKQTTHFGRQNLLYNNNFGHNYKTRNLLMTAETDRGLDSLTAKIPINYLQNQHSTVLNMGKQNSSINDAYSDRD